MSSFMSNDAELMTEIIMILEQLDTEHFKNLKTFYTAIYWLFNIKFYKFPKNAIIFYVCGAYNLAMKSLNTSNDQKITQFINYIHLQIKNGFPKQKPNIIAFFISTVPKSISLNELSAFFKKGMSYAESDISHFFNFSLSVKAPYDFIENYISIILRWKIDQSFDQRVFEKVFNDLYLETKDIMLNINKELFFFVERPEIIAIISISIALEDLNVNFGKIFKSNENYNQARYFCDFLIPNFKKNDVHSKIGKISNIIKEKFPHVFKKKKLSVSISNEINYFPLEFPIFVDFRCPPPPFEMINELICDNYTDSKVLLQRPPVVPPPDKNFFDQFINDKDQIEFIEIDDHDIDSIKINDSESLQFDANIFFNQLFKKSSENFPQLNKSPYVDKPISHKKQINILRNNENKVYRTESVLCDSILKSSSKKESSINLDEKVDSSTAYAEFDVDPNIPQIDVLDCEYMPDDNLSITRLTTSMMKVIYSIKTFSCSARNLKRQVKTYFSKYKSIFFYEIFTNLLDTNFRLQLILELLDQIITSKSVLPYLLYSLALVKKSRQTFDSKKIIFIEVIKMIGLLSAEDYSIIIKYIYEYLISKDSISENTTNYLLNEILQVNKKEISKSNEEKHKSNKEQPKNSMMINESKGEEMDEELDDVFLNLEYDEKSEVIKDEMILFEKGFRGNRYSTETKQFALLLLYSSRYSYYLIKNLFALPCERTLEKFASPFLDKINESIFEISKIYNMLDIQSIHFTSPEVCNLSVDAAVFSPTYGNEIKKIYPFLNNYVKDDIVYNSIFTYLVEPLNPKFHSFPVHIIIKEDGFADIQITERRSEIIQKLKQKNMIFKFTSSDGDKHFDSEHEKAFMEYEKIMESGGSFKDLVAVVDKHDSSSPWPISDPYHLVKNIRSKCIADDEIGISLLEKFNPEEFEHFVTNKNSFKDKSSVGSMKDSYPLSLFGFESFIGSHHFKQSNFLIAPLFLFTEALRNGRLKKDIRKMYFQTSFLFFKYFLHILGYVRTVSTRMIMIRMLNTILGILYSLEHYELNLSHLGTHPVECFYGHLRVQCHYKHTLFNIIHSIGKTVVSNHLMNELQIKKKVYGRINSAGVIVTESKNNIGYFPFNPDDFFIFFLRKLYSLPMKNDDVIIYEKWIKYICENHSNSDYSDNYSQGKFSGSNIFSRNVLISSKVSKNKKKSTEKKKVKCFMKNNYLKSYPYEMNDLIRQSLGDAITKFGNNSFIFLNKFFGFIIQKKELTPKESDKQTFIIPNVFIKYKNAMKQKAKYMKAQLKQLKSVCKFTSFSPKTRKPQFSPTFHRNRNSMSSANYFQAIPAPSPPLDHIRISGDPCFQIKLSFGENQSEKNSK